MKTVGQPGLRAMQALRVVLYSRQSHDSKASISRQDRECLDDIAGEGWPEPERYSDGSSASRFSTKGRDDWEKLLTAIDAGLVDVLVLWESSRGDRTLTTWSALLDLCRKHSVLIRIKTHGRTYDMTNPRDWRSLAEDGVDNAYESEKTSQRLRADLAIKAEEGKPHGPVLYGYRRLYNLRTRALLGQEPDTDTFYIDSEGKRVERRDALGAPWSPAEIVRAIFDDLLGHVPLTVIIDDLNRRGVPAPRMLAAVERSTPLGPERWQASPWSENVVRQMLRNLGYIGTRVHKKRIAKEGAWPAVIEADKFIAVQQVLSDPRRRTTSLGHSGRVAKYLLTCLVTCGNCGREFTYQGPRNDGKHAATYKCRRTCASVPAQALEQHIETAVLYVLTNRKMLALYMADDERQAAEITRANDDAAKLEAKLAYYRQRWLDGHLLDVDYEAQVAKLNPQIRAAKTKAEASTGTNVPDALRQFAELHERHKDIDKRYAAIIAHWGSLDLVIKRELIRFIATVVINPCGKGRSTTGLDELTPSGRKRVEISLRRAA